MNAITRLSPPAAFHGLREARTQPSTFNEADNSFEVIWSTGAAVTRFDWYDGEYYDETLSLEPGAIRLDRLNDSGPVLDAHHDSQIAALIGSVVPGSARVLTGEAVARIRLADSPDVANVIAKVRGGHLRKVSVGYIVHAYERIEREGQLSELRAVDWEPVEISLVPVPADPGAKIRSEDRTMNARTMRTAPPPKGGSPTDDLVTVAFIRRQCQALGLEHEETINVIELYADEPCTRADFLEDMIARASRPRGAAAIPHIDNADTRDSQRTGGAIGTLLTRMQGALYARLAGKAPADESREFMGAGLIDLARGLMMARGERGVQFLSPAQVYQRMGQHTTSDFAILLDGALNSYLTEHYQAAPSPLMRLAKPREVKDFREIRALSISGAPELLLIEENAEYSYGSLSESKESYRIATFGRILALSRQLLINDNLGALQEASDWYVRAAAKLRADAIAAVIGSNPNLADGNPLFHASHGNLAAAGAAISVATLSAGRVAMRGQKDRDGETGIDIAPKYLVVGPAKETEAEQVLTTLAAAQIGDVNPFPGKLELLVDRRIEGNAWYLFAEPAQAPVIEYATLIGQGDSVFTDTRIGFNIDGVETKARIDFGAGVVDHRGAYKNPGN